ncbi:MULTISPECIES: SDR family oxidoreductase [unclassified Streptomyces]|uniref:SDR family oxidoreductase n=1 Tax=unclassified Streptomyces TaxID=2593676 RepID=UPI0035DCB625
MFAVHARTPFFIVQAAQSRLVDGGRVINASSGAAARRIQTPRLLHGKAGINNFTHALAMELGPEASR